MYFPLFDRRVGESNFSLVVVAGMAALAIVLLLWLLEGRAGLSLWDEGFLWYGSQRVALGEVPMRDFLAYDPGRYYWSAAALKLTGNHGILPVRLAAYAFQLLAIWMVLATALTERGRLGVLRAIALVLLLALWMHPRHKLYDGALSLALTAGLALWIRHRATGASIALGVLVGLSAVFGRNHGLYGLIATLLVFLAAREGRAALMHRSVAFGIGCVIGYLPMLLAFVFVPGMAEAFLESLRLMLQYGSTNIPLAVPWPWQEAGGDLTTEELRRLCTGFFFILLVVVPVASLAIFIRRGEIFQKSPLFVAALAVSIPYAHFAFSRPDISHLAQAMPPLVVLLALFPYRKTTMAAWPLSLILAGSALVVGPEHAGWQAEREGWARYVIQGEPLKLPASGATEIFAIERIVETYAGQRPFVAAPFWPGAYALMRRRSPMWEIYSLVPRTESLQRAEIERLCHAEPAVALISDTALDGDPDLVYSRTHPLIYRFLTEGSAEIASTPALPSVGIFLPKPCDAEWTALRDLRQRD